MERGARDGAASASRSSNGVGSSPDAVRAAAGRPRPRSSRTTGSAATSSRVLRVGGDQIGLAVDVGVEIDAGVGIRPRAGLAGLDAIAPATAATASATAAPAAPALAIDAGLAGALARGDRLLVELVDVEIDVELEVEVLIGRSRHGGRAGELLARQGDQLAAATVDGRRDRDLPIPVSITIPVPVAVPVTIPAATAPRRRGHLVPARPTTATATTPGALGHLVRDLGHRQVLVVVGDAAAASGTSPSRPWRSG